MNILILNSILYTPDGESNIPTVRTIKDTMIYGMCLGFLHLGHSVTLASVEDYRPVETEVYDFDVRFFKTNCKRIFKPSVLPYSSEMKKYLKKHCKDFDIIISSEAFQFQSLYAARICPQKTIIWHELALHPSKFHKIPSKIWYNVIVRFFMQKVKGIVPRSKEADLFISKYFKRVSETYIEHGINLRQFSCSKEKSNYLIYVGQLIKRKNITSILHKFCNYVSKFDSTCKLLIIGRGEQNEELKETVADLGIKSNVVFVGFVDHHTLNKLMMRSKAMLIDTLQDNNMVSIPECIVSGTPVLSNLVPTNADIIIDNRLGIAKQEWNEADIKEIVDNNGYFVENCISYREKLSCEFAAKSFIKIFNS